VLSTQDLEKLGREARAHRLAAVAPMTLPVQAIQPAQPATAPTSSRPRGRSTAEILALVLPLTFLLGVITGLFGSRYLGP
jgi:hypothetical protein